MRSHRRSWPEIQPRAQCIGGDHQPPIHLLEALERTTPPRCMYVYYCRTYEKAVSGGGERAYYITIWWTIMDIQLYIELKTIEQSLESQNHQ